MNNIIDNITNNNQVYSEKIGDTILYIVTTENQKNNSFKNMSTIDLGECENELKEIYNINKSLPLIILKVDYFSNYSLIPIIGYEVYDPINLNLLNLSLCNQSEIKLSIPVTIDENELFKYEQNSDFYTSNCFSYTTENGTDIIVRDRKKEFGDKNLSLCENKCRYLGYDTGSKQSSCSCQAKNQMETISEIINSTNKLSNSFLLEKDSSSSSSMASIECTNALFTADGLKTNIASYLLSIIICYFLTSIILFIKCGYPLLKTEIENIIKEKEKMNKYKKGPKNIKHKKLKIKKKNSSNISFPPKKIKKSHIKIEGNLSPDKKNHKSMKSNFNLVNNINNINIGSNTIMNQNKNRAQNRKAKLKNSTIKYNFNDFELNTMDYSQAILYDKRNFCKYYISLIKTKHPLLFGFCPINDYNTIIIKSCIFFLSFGVYYAINFLFFNEEIIHKIYEEGGKYDIIYFIPQIMISFAISHIITIIIKFIFLSERNLRQIKILMASKKENDIINKVERKLIIKYVIFFIMGIIFLFVFWIFLSSFGAVYQNTQIVLVKNTMISFSISFIYPFFINVLPCIFRIISLSNGKKNSECIYNASVLLQLL